MLFYVGIHSGEYKCKHGLRAGVFWTMLHTFKETGDLFVIMYIISTAILHMRTRRTHAWVHSCAQVIRVCVRIPFSGCLQWYTPR